MKQREPGVRITTPELLGIDEVYEENEISMKKPLNCLIRRRTSGCSKGERMSTGFRM